MADTKITVLTAITTVDPAVDVLPIVDISDTTMAASGTTKKITTNQILGSGGTATLASATITGNLTVRTNGLVVDSNGASFSNATPLSGTDAGLALGSIGTIRQFTLGLFNVYARMRERDNSNNLSISTNSNDAGTKDDATKSSWKLRIGSGNDNFALQRAPVGSNTFSDLLIIDSAGVATFSDGAGGTRMTLNSTGLGVGGSPTGYGILALKKDNTSSPPYIVLDNRGTGASDTNTYTQGGILFGAYRDVSNPAYIASITVERKSAIGGASSTGDLIFGTAATPTTGAATERMRIDSAGNPIFQPSATPATLGTNGMLTVNATSNTNLRFSYRGSDGTTRVANITLA
jgi:hypothetical protein